MAALSDPWQEVEIGHSHFRRELDPLLLEETVEWHGSWIGISPGRRTWCASLPSMRSPGFALLDRGEVVGYGYSVLEDHKGLIGDLYVRPAWRDGVRRRGCSGRFWTT